MSGAWIVQTAAVTALGDSLEATWRRLLAGESGIRPVRRFATEGYVSGLAATIGDLGEEDGGSRVYPLLDRLLAGFRRGPRRRRSPDRDHQVGDRQPGAAAAGETGADRRPAAGRAAAGGRPPLRSAPRRG